MPLEKLYTMVENVTERVKGEKAELEKVMKEERNLQLIEGINKHFESVGFRADIIDRIEDGHNSCVISVNEIPYDCFNVQNFTYEDLVLLCDYISENSKFTARCRHAVEGESYYGCNSFVIVLSWDVA